MASPGKWASKALADRDTEIAGLRETICARNAEISGLRAELAGVRAANTILRRAGRQDSAGALDPEIPVTRLREIVGWWDGLPPRLRQDIEGSGAEPGVIARARGTLACRI